MPSNPRDHIPGLDGLRAVAVLLVIFCHASTSNGFPSTELSRRLALGAAQGVEIFFVISGFLITWLLLEEERKSGSISLSRFYVRRAFRILPASTLYLLVIAAAGALGYLAVSWKELAASLFFFRTWVTGSLATGHFWTLAIEEQYYLIWPLVLIRLRKEQRLQAVAALILFAPFWNHVNILLFGARSINNGRIDLRYASLLTGCLLALLRSREATRKLLSARWLRHPAMPAVFAALFALSGSALTQSLPSWVRFLAPTAGTAAVALLINSVSDDRGTLIDRALAAAPIVWIGRISYGLYLWQQIFCRYDPGQSTPWMRTFPLNVACTFAAASLSYYCLETPMLRLRDRLLDKRAVFRGQPLLEPR